MCVYVLISKRNKNTKKPKIVGVEGVYEVAARFSNDTALILSSILPSLCITLWIVKTIQVGVVLLLTLSHSLEFYGS